MGTATRRCKVCNKAGAATFNDLCNGCWVVRIEQNIKKFVQEQKKKDQH